ncbi:MAG: helix-turn-helix domain-containing protein [Syntrophobacteraceae bacterium]
MQDTDSHAILEAPDKTAWNKAKAARLLRLDRVTLYRKIKSYNLTKDTPRC